MKLTNGYQGLIWEVPMGPELGFAYVRTTIIKEQVAIYTSILAYRSHRRLASFNEVNFDEIDDLVAPFMGLGAPTQKGENRWKALGYVSVNLNSLLVPDLKASHPLTIPPEKNSWGVFRGCATSDVLRDDRGEAIFFSYEKIKHLGYYGHTFLKFATPKIILEWMKILGLDYLNYETDVVYSSTLWEYKYAVLTSVPYSEVPPEIRGKALF
jgi:hypothetical protein